MLTHQDMQLRAQVCAFLAQIGKHTEDMAHLVVNKSTMFPFIVKQIASTDEVLRKNATVCLQVVTKYTEEVLIFLIMC